MFSSEQVLKISGEMNQLEMAIRFSLNMYGQSKTISYQIAEDNKYCLGWCCDEKYGWLSYPFDFDVHIVSEIIEQHLKKQEIEDPYSWCDGSSNKGFLLKAINQTFADKEEGIIHPFYGIISIEPFINFYAK